MNRWGPLLLIALLLAGFVMVANAIIGVKLLELRVKISRERILNYELSSRVLKEKFLLLMQDQKQAFDSEVRQNLLESSIMNDRDPDALTLDLNERIGYWVINLIRPLALKPFLQLLADQEQLIMMKYAFFMERNRRYDKAIDKYKDLQELLPRDNSDARGFVLLHLGYCQAITGATNEAIEGLELVQADFAGSHYAQTAAVLLDLLRDARQAQAELEKEDLSNIEKARRLYALSRFKASIALFRKEKSLSAMDEYRLARSLEETGQVKKAIADYMRIVQQNRDSVAVLEANRRLLLIGNFYGGGQQVRQMAEKKARDLGDDKAVDVVVEVAANRRKDVILEEIREKANSLTPESKADPMLRELGAEIEESISLEEKLIDDRMQMLDRIYFPRIEVPRQRIDRPLDPIDIPDQGDFLTANPSLKGIQEDNLVSSARLFGNLLLQISLRDQRILQGEELLLQGDQLLVRKSDSQFSIPLDLVGTVQIPQPDADANAFFLVQSTDASQLKTRQIMINAEGQWILRLVSGDERVLQTDQIRQVVIP
ncbi:MAG: hypothetical protein KDK39_00325 [Leptospiraceae bacterium]|nr:hypothetical protein [Leptospiraceae bacterium]